jgi:plastocyanin
MRRSLLLTTLVALILPGTAVAADVQVGDFSFRPDYTRIDPGETVTWTVLGNASPHTVNSGAGAPAAFDSTELLPGQAFSFTFAAAGRYPYHCNIHPFMKGVVQVGPDTVDPKLTKLKAKLGKSNVRVFFRLSETSRVSAKLASAGKPRKVLERVRAKKLRNGARSLTVATKDLAAGRYRVTVSAKDPEGNLGTARIAFRIPG